VFIAEYTASCVDVKALVMKHRLKSREDGRVAVSSRTLIRQRQTDLLVSD
jgi:hypothetical protein